jgi:hypothetical protein
MFSYWCCQTCLKNNVIFFLHLHLSFLPSSSIRCSNCAWLACCCHFNYFQLEVSGKSWYLVTISSLLCCLHEHLFFGLEVTPVEWSHVCYCCQDCVMNDFQWDLYVTTVFAPLNCCSGVAFRISCEFLWQTVVFHFLVTIYYVTASSHSYLNFCVSITSWIYCKLNY